jgi:hypothetical protein
MMVEHADAIAQNCAAGVGAGGIDCDYADGFIFLAEGVGYFVN